MLVGLTGTVLSIIAATRNKQTDNRQEGREDGIVLTEIGYVKAGIDDLKLANRDLRNDFQSLHDLATQTAESCKQAHKRIDKLEKYHQPK